MPTCATCRADRRWSRTSSTCCARTARRSAAIRPRSTTRLGTLVLTNDAAETAGTTEFLRGLAGAELDEQFVIGEPDDVVRKVGPLIDAGLDCLIFNMPLSQPDAVARAGKLLTSTFS